MLLQSVKDRFSLSIGREAKDPAEFRAHQLKAVIGITPLMMAGNAINATIICIAFAGKPFALGVFVWTALIYAMAFTGYHSWRKSNAHSFPSRISARTLRKVAINSTLLGLLWGVVPLMAYPGGDLATKLVIVAFSGGMMGGGCFALYMVPHALAGYLSGIFGSFFVALVMSRGPGDLAVGALAVMYFISLLAASLTIARMFATAKISASQLEEQASIIGLLLNDFEESASDWLWETDASGTMTRGAQRFHQATGIAQDLIEISSNSAMPQALRNTVHGNGFAKLWQSIQMEAAFNGLELSFIRDERSEIWISLSGKPLVDKEGKFTGYRGVASDITNDKLANERIAYLAHNDALTGLVNRTHFSQAIERCLESRRLTDGAQFSVFYLDLDGFKLINDTKGHRVGDELLVEVGVRLKKALRDNDVVARLGGDEFGILLRHEFSTRYLSALAEKIIDAINKPYEIDGHIVSVGLSIGIAIAPQDGSDVEALLNSADLGLYRAKEQGKGTFRFFETKMDDIVRDRRILEQELRGALAADQFELHFQPLVSALDDTTSGFEALIRWNHPTRGQVPPSDFIPLAEKTGLICEIGDWVLMEACRTAAAWPEHMTISVNLSPQQFQNRRVVKSTKLALEATGLTPARLELEITESLFVDNTEEALTALNDLKALGVMTSLDDFGTGYSSLSYLLEIPVRQAEDRPVLHPLHREGQDRARHS